jgi:glycogen synthase
MTRRQSHWLQRTAFMNKPLRIYYAAGPGDVIATYRHWLRGEDDPQHVGMTISGMFYESCREHGDRAYVVASCSRPDKIEDDQFLIVHRPILFMQGPALAYYFGQMIVALRLIASALWFRADVAVISCGTTFWFPLRVLPVFGVQVVPSLHCVPRPKYHPLSRVQQIFFRLSREFFVSTATRILSMSLEISDQLQELAGGLNKPIIEFLPTYRAPRFAGITSPKIGQRPFRVCFAGRIEGNKGVFDLLSIAKRFEAAGRRDIIFDICGSGSALDELRRQARDAGIEERFRCHGYCDWEAMRRMYSESHAVIVPTTSQFSEGFNQVVSEGVLAGRPVITSPVCPALAYVQGAAVEVPVDDVAAYGNAIIKLCDDDDFYRGKCSACLQVQQQFYDLRRSWMAALGRALSIVRGAQEENTVVAPLNSAR